MQKNRLNVFIAFFLCFFGCGTLFISADDFFKLKKQIVERAWKKAAFFYITPTITLNNLGYTSNIYSYQELEEPDWTADLGLKLEVSSILGNRFIFTITEDPYYSFYAKNKDQQAFNNRLKAALYTYLGRINLKYQFSDDFIRGRPTSEFGVPVGTHIKEHLFSLDVGRYKNFFINLYLKQRKLDHDEEHYLGNYDLKYSLDQKELRGGINLNKIIFSQTRLFLNYEYFEYKFDYELLRNGIGGQLSLGVEFPEISSIKGYLQFGLKTFKTSSSLYRNYTIPFGSGEVYINLFRRLKLHLLYLVDNFYSYWGERRYNEKSAGAGVEYYLTKRIKIGYQYRFGKLSYEDLNLSGEDDTRLDDFFISTLSFGIKIFKNMGIGLEYRMYRSDSSELDFTRNNNFIGGYFTHEF